MSRDYEGPLWDSDKTRSGNTQNRETKRSALKEFMHRPGLGTFIGLFVGLISTIFGALRKLFSSSSKEAFAEGGKAIPPNKTRRVVVWSARLFVVVSLCAFIFWLVCLTYVKPNQYGIKVVRMGFDRGVQKKINESGYHFVIPGAERMLTLPKDLLVLELTNNPQNAADGVRVDKAAHIQTSDGFFVDADVSFVYKIVDPYLAFTSIGPGHLYEDNGIIPKAEPAIKETLGTLSTEDFYNSPLRVEKASQTKNKLNAELALKGLQVEQVLVRYFEYSPEIQKNIEQKKLQDQMVFTNQAKARAAKEGAEIKKIAEEGKVAVSVEMEKGNAYVTRKLAEKDLYVRKKKANADLLVQLSEAEKTRLKNTALEGLGADRMVGLKMAEVYNGLSTIILSSDGANGVNPLNIDKTLRLFDVREAN